MILYNVTINIEDDVHDEWLRWMVEEHIPQVLGTGLFTGYKMFRILTRHPDETGTTYSVQYYARTLEDYENYRDNLAPAFQAETARLFNGKYYAFRTVLEEI